MAKKSEFLSVRNVLSVGGFVWLGWLLRDYWVKKKLPAKTTVVGSLADYDRGWQDGSNDYIFSQNKRNDPNGNSDYQSGYSDARSNNTYKKNYWPD